MAGKRKFVKTIREHDYLFGLLNKIKHKNHLNLSILHLISF